jgi:hypothetical protein
MALPWLLICSSPELADGPSYAEWILHSQAGVTGPETSCEDVGCDRKTSIVGKLNCFKAFSDLHLL